jgi:hypothetical protein
MCAYPSHVGPVVGGACLEEEQVEQKVSVVHKPQVMRSVTQYLSKTIPGAYRSHNMINMTCFTIFACINCALRVGSCMMVIGYMVVPFRMSSLL